MKPLILQSLTCRTRNDISMRCVQQHGSGARKTSDWKGQRKAWIADQRQRRFSSEAPQQRVRGKQLDEDALASGTRFLAFPRMVSALDRHSRGSESYTPDDGSAAHSHPARGPRQHRSRVDPAYSPTPQLDTLRSRLPVEAPAADSLTTAPVMRSGRQPQPSYGRQGQSPQVGAPHMNSRRPTGTAESFLPTPLRDGTASERQTGRGTELASRHAPGPRVMSRQPPQHAQRPQVLQPAQFEDRAWPSRPEVHNRFPGLLRHNRRVREGAQQSLPQPGRSAPLAAELASPKASATPVAFRGGYVDGKSIDRRERGSCRLRGYRTFPQQQTSPDYSSPQEEEQFGEEQQAPFKMQAYPAQQLVPPHQSAPSADDRRENLQPSLGLESSEAPFREVQGTSDHTLSADTGSQPPGRRSTATSSYAEVPAAAVWEALALENDMLSVGGASGTPGGVWAKLFHQEPAATKSTTVLESPDFHAAGREQQQDAGCASSQQSRVLVADAVEFTADLASSAVFSPSLSGQQQEHEYSTQTADTLHDSEAADVAPTPQGTVQSSAARSAADSALFTAAGVAGASVFLLQSLASREKLLPQALPSGAEEEQLQLLPTTRAVARTLSDALPDASIPEVSVNVVEQLRITPEAEAPLGYLEVDAFQDSDSLPTPDASEALRSDLFSTSAMVLDPSSGCDDTERTPLESEVEVVLTLESEVASLDTSEVLPEHGKLVLATPQMQAPQIQSRMWAYAGTSGTELRWQQQLPPRAKQVVEFAKECTRVWYSVFPKKSEEQQRMEQQVRKAVLNGDLHWSALNQVKQGKPIMPEQIAEAKRMAQ